MLVQGRWRGVSYWKGEPLVIYITGAGGNKGVRLCSQCTSPITVLTRRALIKTRGRPRARRREEPVVQVLDSSDEDIAAQVKTDDDFVPPKTSTGSKVLDHLPPASDVETRARVLEAPEIEALLMTHRARIPIAVTLAHDYSAITWRVPRAFIVLGWFWITDAWVRLT
jgi:hypothetical protein